ncbi:MAG: putative flavodoxin [Paenibacillaceae bacterium]|jgi:flavodoxin|nr:putative flavodoxin [Paenibacillaceae bacterium]
MKKNRSFILALLFSCILTACGNDASPLAEQTQPSSPNPQREEKSLEAAPSDGNNKAKTLVVYFSQPETNDANKMTKEEDNSTVVIDGKVLGNTQYVAYVIQENTGADIFRIEPEIPYPLDHTTLIDQAKEEQNRKFRPAIKARIENMDQYGTIFLGYPNWWSDMPMILYTFLEKYDLAGKTIIPFNTHGGSGFSNTVKTIAELAPEAKVNKNGLTISRNVVQEAEGDIIAWLKDLGY